MPFPKDFPAAYQAFSAGVAEKQKEDNKSIATPAQPSIRSEYRTFYSDNRKLIALFESKARAFLQSNGSPSSNDLSQSETDWSAPVSFIIDRIYLVSDHYSSLKTERAVYTVYSPAGVSGALQSSCLTEHYNSKADDYAQEQYFVFCIDENELVRDFCRMVGSEFIDGLTNNELGEAAQSQFEEFFRQLQSRIERARSSA